MLAGGKSSSFTSSADATLAFGSSERSASGETSLDSIKYTTRSARPRAGAFGRAASFAPSASFRRCQSSVLGEAADDEIEHLQNELNSILAFVEQLSEVKVDGVEPMTSVTPMQMKKRQDVVTAGGNAEAILKNAPATQDNYFLVPKVVE